MKKVINNVIIVILCGIIVFCGYKISEIYMNNQKTKNIQNKLSLSSESLLGEKGKVNIETYSEKFHKLKQENSDFKGWIRFESGLVNLPFVQGKDNEEYLRRDFNHNYSVAGTVFMDGYQNLNSQNITLYGHYIYSDASLMFSPIEKLTKMSNYKHNDTVKLYLENEIRVYRVLAAVNYNEAYYEPIHQLGDFSVDQLALFFDLIEHNKYYDTGVTYNENDRFLTLQTCVRGIDEARTLIIAKEIARENH